jgi:hypothetical protein
MLSVSAVALWRQETIESVTRQLHAAELSNASLKRDHEADELRSARDRDEVRDARVNQPL